MNGNRKLWLTVWVNLAVGLVVTVSWSLDASPVTVDPRDDAPFVASRWNGPVDDPADAEFAVRGTQQRAKELDTRERMEKLGKQFDKLLESMDFQPPEVRNLGELPVAVAESDRRWAGSGRPSQAYTVTPVMQRPYIYSHGWPGVVWRLRIEATQRLTDRSKKRYEPDWLQDYDALWPAKVVFELHEHPDWNITYSKVAEVSSTVIGQVEMRSGVIMDMANYLADYDNAKEENLRREYLSRQVHFIELDLEKWHRQGYGARAFHLDVLCMPRIGTWVPRANWKFAKAVPEQG